MASLTAQERGGKKRPSYSQDDSTTAGPSNRGPKSKHVFRSKLITMKRMDDASTDPIIGTGVLCVLNNSDIPNVDLLIYKHIWYDGKNKIYQASPDGHNTEKSLRVCLLDEVVSTDCFRTVLCFEHLDELKTGINFSWFVNKGLLMFNVHLTKDAILENMESMKKTEAATHHEVSFFNELVSGLHPNLEQQIKEHSWINEYYPPKEDDFASLYQTLRSARATPPSYNLRLDSLACTLRGYQKNAVDFLIHREIEPAVDVGLVHEWVDTFVGLRSQFTCRSFEIVNGLFYLPSLGRFVRDVSEPSVNVVGGVLAEEMGLGKTVELLGLILSHQSDDDTRMLRRTRKATNDKDSDE